MGCFRYEELSSTSGPIGLLTLDVPDKKVNTLSRGVLSELASHVDQLEQRADLRGLLFRSGKPGQFIAGADLKELAALIDATREQCQQAIAAGHALFRRISQLPFPVVALVDGNSMGGGTELILSMDERIATTNPATKIALPETKIGLIPGWGGTQRLTRLVGVQHAIEIICGGEAVSAAKAVQIGLCFDAVPADKLIEVGRAWIDRAHATGEWKATRQQRSQPLGLTENELNFAFACAEGAIQGKTKGQYPAPLAALKAIKLGINRPLDEGLKIEQEVALEVTGTLISTNLISVFFMNQALGRDPGFLPTNAKGREVKSVGVLGSGLMGAGIATAHARRGVPAVMVDVGQDRLADGMKRACQVIESRIKIGRATPQDLTEMLTRLSASTSRAVFSDCDVVVEAITENEELKKQAYGELKSILRDEAILCSNTSTISITRMAEAAPHPERFIGMHFFYPVDRMELVEVIRGAKTDDDTVATIVALARRIGKTPIVMRDCPGFLVNRVLLPYMNEAVLLLQEGASMDDIDKAATTFGMPMGPIMLSDLVGLDTAYYAGQVVSTAYADRAKPTPLLGDLVQAGRLGNKSGSGFRKLNKKGKPEADPDFAPFLEKHRTDNRAFTPQELTDRLFLPMLLEATRVLEEGIVAEPHHVDMGLILGIGFPPFRGGILHWCDSEGAAAIEDRLSQYVNLGKRFEPTDSIRARRVFFPRGSVSG
jgi:3-hydroxyacyl-CoA dehydrogenase/enoyl-CoA hydratase/3-hydroxybutyryl-CoA epimerase/3-hydroxyacyl-CoA dehydrogenase/enoyl-CoA hydratase/3-hydroxybutyryl-CoA epimerase/enoyl-CoA isomerase